jgi:hypothetical protein
MVRFDCGAWEHETMREIAERAAVLARRAGVRKVSVQAIWMDLIATHVNGCPLRLEEMRHADDFNLAHDVFGIGRHLNRDTGALEGCFVPRFAAQ